METLSRTELIGLVAVVVAVIAAIANILAMNSARPRRALLFLLTIAVLSFLGLLYKVESVRIAKEQSKIEAQNREAQDAASREEAKNKQKEARQEEVIEKTAEELRKKEHEKTAIDRAAQEIGVNEENAKKEHDLREATNAILGTWYGGSLGKGLLFSSDGHFKRLNNPILQLVDAIAGPGADSIPLQGTYKFTDATHMEITFHALLGSSVDGPYKIEVQLAPNALVLKGDAYSSSLIAGSYKRD